jgi:hypothetical protein
MDIARGGSTAFIRLPGTTRHENSASSAWPPTPFRDHLRKRVQGNAWRGVAGASDRNHFPKSENRPGTTRHTSGSSRKEERDPRRVAWPNRIRAIAADLERPRPSGDSVSCAGRLEAHAAKRIDTGSQGTGSLPGCSVSAPENTSSRYAVSNLAGMFSPGKGVHNVNLLLQLAQLLGSHNVTLFISIERIDILWREHLPRPTRAAAGEAATTGWGCRSQRG